MPLKNNPENDYTYPQKVWIAGGILSLLFVFLWLLGTTFSVLLLVLGGILIAVYFRGLSDLIERKTNWNSTLCLVISIVGTLLLIAGMVWLIESKLQTQVAELSDTIPQTIDRAKSYLNESPVGQKIINHLSSPGVQEKAKTLASTFFKSTFGILGDVYVVLFLGVFFTISPFQYKKGIIALVPDRKRPKAEVVLDTMGDHLKKWLKGKIFAMMVVFVLTAIGLVIIGVPMWLALALIAGMLNFIPNFGPLIAMIPAALIGLLQGPATAGIVVGLYLFVQVLESNFITPQIQKKLVNLPPALIIVAQLLMGVLTGGWGLLLATPLLLLIIVLIQETYIKPIADGD